MACGDDSRRRPNALREASNRAQVH